MATCVERKMLLSGREKRYACDLLLCQPGFCVLKYVLDQRARVGSLDLDAGTITYGFYWSDRPYTLYKWITPANVQVGNYFNLADQISISKTEVVWRDLILDVLVKQDGAVEILDESELVQVEGEKMQLKIESGKRTILRNYSEVIESTSLLLKELKRRV